MVTKKVLIANKIGLHARPAGVFSRTAAQFQSNIIIDYNDKKVDAKSILNLLSAGIAGWSTITITAEGEDENEAIDKLCELVQAEAE
ncbi:MAG TPA: HPr family phosphocarrier protein [Anaerovoracaceae bacterium]|nr:HPr family phosphocarrier protein [Anaerovoracaceae bacterium]